jgi:hypothetical protein
MIPPYSPLASGWRAELTALILANGLSNVLDAVSAFAELRSRRVEGQTGLFDRMEAREIAAPSRRRINRKTERLRAEARADGRGRIVA